MLRPGDQFNNNSSPIGDILFICLGAFILLFFVAHFETAGLRERLLSDLNLSKLATGKAGRSLDNSVTISAKNESRQLQLVIDGRRVAPEQLGEELRKLGGLAKVSLRRDKALTVAEEDTIIAACTRAGIEKVSLVVQMDEEMPQPE